MNTLNNRETLPWAENYTRIESYAEIREIMQSQAFDQGNVERRHFFQGDTILLQDGQEHLERKKIFSPLFSRSTLTEYEKEILDPTIDKVMSDLRADDEAGEIIHTDLVPLIRSMLYRIAARVVGVDGVNTPERTEHFRILVDRVGEALQGSFSRRPTHEVQAEGLATFKELVEHFLGPSLERRRIMVRDVQNGELDKHRLEKDALTLICLHGGEEKTREGDTEFFSYVWREVAFFLTASTQTTTHTLPHVVLHLLDWFDRHPEDASHLSDLAFLRRAVGDGLRLHQSAPARFRTANQDVTLASGRKVTKGEKLAMFPAVANEETELFGDDAQSFNPHRQCPASLNPWGLTFGAGVHLCMGRSLVTGVYREFDDREGTEGSMVRILKALFSRGVKLDKNRAPQRVSNSYHDAFESIPIVLNAVATAAPIDRETAVSPMYPRSSFPKNEA